MCTYRLCINILAGSENATSAIGRFYTTRGGRSHMTDLRPHVMLRDSV
jgi:hypothetical protein